MHQLQINQTAAKIMICSCVQITQNYRKQSGERALAEMTENHSIMLKHATGKLQQQHPCCCQNPTGASIKGRVSTGQQLRKQLKPLVQVLRSAT